MNEYEERLVFCPLCRSIGMALSSTNVFIHRLAKIWKVAPYRIDAKVSPNGVIEFITLDDQEPGPQYVEMLEKDVLETVRKAKEESKFFIN